MATYGNKKYLFGDDIYSVREPGEYEDYDVPGEYLTDQEFANMMREAEKYLGMAYVWGGDNPTDGFDCSGFVSWVINHCGNGWNYGRQTADGLKNSTARVSASDVKPGDLIFFKGTYNTIALGKPVQSSLAVLGEISISGTMIKAENLADTLQVCLDSGAKKVLLPQTSAVDLGTVPPDLMSSFNLIFYQSAEDAVFKALGVE